MCHKWIEWTRIFPIIKIAVHFLQETSWKRIIMFLFIVYFRLVSLQSKYLRVAYFYIHITAHYQGSILYYIIFGRNAPVLFLVFYHDVIRIFNVEEAIFWLFTRKRYYWCFTTTLYKMRRMKGLYTPL